MARSKNPVNKILLRFYNVNVAIKIILPFVAMALFISLIGGMAVSAWITDILDQSAEDLTRSATVSTEKTFSLYENRMQTYTEHLAATSDLPPAIRTADVGAIRHLLLPQDIAADTDFLEVVDVHNRVIFCSSGPYAIGDDIGWLSLIQGAEADQTTVDIVTSPAGYVFACAAPVFDENGLAGYIISGYFANNTFLDRLQLTSNLDISLYSNNKLIMTNHEDRWRAGCSTKGCHTEGFAGAISGRTDFSNMAPSTVNMLGKLYMIDHGSVSFGLNDDSFVTILYPMGSIVRVQNIARGTIFILAAVLMILITTLGYLIGKGIATPLRELSSISKRVSRGDLSPRMDYPGTKDEVGELSESFNRMTESLQRYTSNLRKRLLELSVLYETSVSTRTVYNLENLVELIIQNVGKAVNGDSGSLLLVDETSSRLVLKSGFNIPASLVDRVTFDIDTGNFEWLSKKFKRSGDEIDFTLNKMTAACISIRNNKSLLATRHDQDPEIRQLLIDTKSSSIVCVPLRTRDVALGVIILSRSESKAPFSEEDRNFLITMSAQSAAYIDNRKLIENLRESYIATVKALAEAVDAKDQYTRGHSSRVAAYAVAIARELNLSDDEIEGIETAAYLHDVGKIGISDHILLKPGKLTLQEMETVRSHPKIGAKILAPINFPWEIVPIIFQHHERYSGGGYPNKLSYEEIHIGARILVVADSYEAMTSERPYRAALSQQTAIEELKKGSGTQFDPVIVEAFLKILERGFDEELAAAQANAEQ